MSNWPTWEESRRRREKAIELRKRGLSYKEIHAMVGGSYSSLSLWLRDIPLSPEHRARLRKRRLEGVRKTSAALHQRRLNKEANIRAAAVAELGRLSERDLFVAGVVAYAAEGSKQKPWSTGCTTQFTNSDPRMIRLFLRWLEGLGVERRDISFRLAVHETADVEGALAFWSDFVGVPSSEFRRTSLKRSRPRIRRRNVGALYRGCLTVDVRRSSDLTRQIDGWFEALVLSADDPLPSARPTPQATLGPRR